MNDPKRSGSDEGNPSPDDDAELSARLQRLNSRLGEISNEREVRSRARPRGSSNASGLGQALRLSAEFISGVIAGGIVGWLIDLWLGVSPFGFIVGLLLGFGSGMLNMLRASGEMNRRSDPTPPSDAEKRRGDDGRS